MGVARYSKWCEEKSMATAVVIHIVKQIKNLSPTEQQELQRALEKVLPSTPTQATEEDFRRALVAAGLLSSPSPEARAKSSRRRSFKPVPVRGRPISETLIEERR
jgi:hypothetical protein